MNNTEKDPAITPEKMDELLAFLPALSRPERETIREWDLRRKEPEGTIVLTPPIYEADIYQFFRLAAQPWWCDYNYVPKNAMAMLEDDRVIASATLDQVKTMLTLCVRGERFCDGLWASVLSAGRVTALLRRLQALRGEITAL